jgi:hypothetical protein
MAKRRKLDFEIDKLTNSIVDAQTSEPYETEIVRLSDDDIPSIRNSEWQFDWAQELRGKGREVYKLVTRKNPSVIQGLISLAERYDHIFIYLLESAPFNIGQKKIFDGVAGNLVAFGCKKSFATGYEGCVAFEAKTRLIKHYEETLGAQRSSANRMFIDTREAHILVRKYFPDFDQ